MKTQLKIAVAAAVLSLSGVATAADHVDLGTAQQRAEQGLSPTGAGSTIPLAEAALPQSRQLGESQQLAEAGEGYTPAQASTAVAVTPTPPVEKPVFGIGEAQQIAESGEGYNEELSAPRQVAQSDGNSTSSVQ
jgi:hypothetical protein